MECNKRLYHKVYERMLEDANVGKLPYGTAIPTVRQLLKLYDTRQSTLCKALSELKKDGYIVTRQGGGIYLNPEKFKPELAAQRNPSSAKSDVFRFGQGGLLASEHKVSVLRISFLDDRPNHRAMWKQIFSRYKIQNPDCEVDLSFGNAPDDQRRLESDLVQLQTPQILETSWQERLYPIPLSTAETVRYPAHTFDHMTGIDGRIYGVPVFLTLPMLLVNTKLMELGGVKFEGEEMDWEQFKSAAMILGASHRAGKFPDGTYVAAYIHSSFLYLCASSPYLKKGLKTGGFDWARKEVRKFMHEIAELGVKNSIIMPNAHYFRQGGIKRMFSEGKLAMAAVLSYDVNNMYPAGLPSHVKALPFPLTASGSTFWNAGYFCISRNSRHTGECLSLLRFLSSPDVMGIVARHNEMPALPDGVAGINPCYTKLLDHAMPTNILNRQQIEIILNAFNPIADYARDGVMSPDTAYELLLEKYQDLRRMPHASHEKPELQLAAV